MIFGRKKKDLVESALPEPVDDPADEDDTRDETDEEASDSAVGDQSHTGAEADGSSAKDADEDETDDEDDEDDEDEVLDEWALFDRSTDWRADGPFDIEEVDLSADEVARVDLGAVVITPEPGMNIRLIANPETKQILYLVVDTGKPSAVQITVLAAPAEPGYASVVRQDIVDHSTEAKVVELAKGPFGTELHRILAVTDDQGREGFSPLRDWFISGPRWVLNARLMGQAALDAEGTGASAEFEEFVRNIVVRRGDQAMVPGAILALHTANAT